MARSEVMLSSAVIQSDAFLDMSAGAQALYSQLCMGADGIGALDGVKSIVRACGSSMEAFGELVAAGFVARVLIDGEEAYFVRDWFVNNNLNNRDMSTGRHAWLALAGMVFESRDNRRYLVIGSDPVPRGYCRLQDCIEAFAKLVEDMGGAPNGGTTGAQGEPAGGSDGEQNPRNRTAGTQGEHGGNPSLNEMKGNEYEMNPKGKEGETRAPAREGPPTVPCPECGAECAADVDGVGLVRGWCPKCDADFSLNPSTGEYEAIQA